MKHSEIIEFWFSELKAENWFVQNDEIDKTIIDRFSEIYTKATAGELDDWQNKPEGALALIIILDQFPRNMFRKKPQSFAFDHLAREVSNRAIEKGFDMLMDFQKRIFVYMPFMHSEKIEDQDACIKLIAERMGEKGKNNLIHAKAHRHVIEMFGRFPFRNEALSRNSTAEESKWLKEGGYGKAVQLFEEDSDNS